MMSEQNQQLQLLDPDSAFGVLHRNVYAPKFFEKLAVDYGVQPTNEQEMMQMLTMAAQLREGHEQNEKAAAAQGNPLLNMAQQHLNESLGQSGYETSNLYGDLIEKTAAYAASNPDIAHAVLSLQAQAALAQQQQQSA
jgi:hypothetical protein